MGYKYVTIIIPVHNAEKTLPYVLRSLARTEYAHDHVKVVIVNAHSTDRSLEVAEDFKQRYSQRFCSVEVIELGQRATTSRARNEGARRAIPGSYLMFLDSDVILKPATLKDLLTIAEDNPHVGAVGALYITSSPSLFEKLMWYRYLGKVSEGPAGTGALLIKPEVFERVGPFNESLGYPRTIYEDLEYVMRIRRNGYKVLIDGRDPLLHFKPPQGGNWRKERSLEHVVKHYASYFSLSKAYALYEALRVAPMRYKLEYVAYVVLPVVLALVGVLSSPLLLLALTILLFSSSLYSLISYGTTMSTALKIVAGPAILLSRVLRAITLMVYVVARVVTNIVLSPYHKKVKRRSK